MKAWQNSLPKRDRHVIFSVWRTKLRTEVTQLIAFSGPVEPTLRTLQLKRWIPSVKIPNRQWKRCKQVAPSACTSASH